MNEYVRNNLVPQIKGIQASNYANNTLPTTDFQQLLMDNIRMAWNPNHGQNRVNHTSFLQPFSGFPASLHPESHMQSLGNNVGQALSRYQTSAQWEGQSAPVTSEGSLQKSLHKEPPTNQFNGLIEEAAHKYGVDANLIHSIIKMESNYNPSVESHAGAVGLMQLMPSTAKAVGVTDRHDIAQNIDGGVHYFSKMLKNQKGNVELALAAYNAGPGNVKKYGGIPPFKETQNYIKKVMDYYQS